MIIRALILALRVLGLFTLVRADYAPDVAVPIEMDYPNQELMMQ